MRRYFQREWNAGTAAALDCARVKRVGDRGDGGKLVCLDAMPPPTTPCRVVSVGAGGDFSFEVRGDAELGEGTVRDGAERGV